MTTQKERRAKNQKEQAFYSMFKNGVRFYVELSDLQERTAKIIQESSKAEVNGVTLLAMDIRSDLEAINHKISKTLESYAENFEKAVTQ
ncbi:MAG: hypothetical protein CMJ19_05040 [Phycisphaeraceae bacterium]|nr:hypothetical protein [Phycisphaeraceae bacterium]|tara:strand:+ start:239 stop:505 length:267 start_codon:yes stop_codon:yes gene_type:complete